MVSMRGVDRMLRPKGERRGPKGPGPCPRGVEGPQGLPNRRRLPAGNRSCIACGAANVRITGACIICNVCGFRDGC